MGFWDKFTADKIAREQLERACKMEKKVEKKIYSEAEVKILLEVIPKYEKHMADEKVAKEVALKKLQRICKHEFEFIEPSCYNSGNQLNYFKCEKCGKVVKPANDYVLYNFTLERLEKYVFYNK